MSNFIRTQPSLSLVKSTTLTTVYITQGNLEETLMQPFSPIVYNRSGGLQFSSILLRCDDTSSGEDDIKWDLEDNLAKWGQKSPLLAFFGEKTNAAIVTHYGSENPVFVVVFLPFQSDNPGLYRAIETEIRRVASFSTTDISGIPFIEHEGPVKVIPMIKKQDFFVDDLSTVPFNKWHTPHARKQTSDIKRFLKYSNQKARRAYMSQDNHSETLIFSSCDSLHDSFKRCLYDK